MRLGTLLTTVALAVSPIASSADWIEDGSPVSLAVNGQYNPRAISDGAGGAIIVWEDARVDFGAPTDIYAQRIDASGARVWSNGWDVDGIPLCSAPGSQYNPQIATDGMGGAFIVWVDERGGFDAQLYAQHVNTDGVLSWQPDGLPICPATVRQSSPQLVSDGAGGVIITWSDYRSYLSETNTGTDVFAQRLSRMGVVWTTLGVPVSSPPGDQTNARLVSDGARGAIVTWEDKRTPDADIYVQRIDAAGAPLWTTDGVVLFPGGFTQWGPDLVSDETGGAIVAWCDYRKGSFYGSYDIYAQRVSATGTGLWTPGGVVVCEAPKGQFSPRLVSDGAGGAIIVWEDDRIGWPYDPEYLTLSVFAQRVNGAGTMLWISDGVPICTAPGKQHDISVVGDGAGGAIITWEDFRELTWYPDVYAQHVNSAGAAQWTTDGAAVCALISSQKVPQIVTDGVGGAIIAWGDVRNDHGDIYAQHVSDPSLAAAIESFGVKATGRAAELTCSFRTEFSDYAINVYRSQGQTTEPLLLIYRAVGAKSNRFEYVDRNVQPGRTYHYQVGIEDTDGEYRSQIVTFEMNAAVARLRQNAPNPFNPSTMIEYSLGERSPAVLEIFDATGTLVASLDQGIQNAGAHQVLWDGRDAQGRSVAAGVYFYRLKGIRNVGSKKMVLLK